VGSRRIRDGVGLIRFSFGQRRGEWRISELEGDVNSMSPCYKVGIAVLWDYISKLYDGCVERRGDASAD
jgi:hypothetical protein